MGVVEGDLVSQRKGSGSYVRYALANKLDGWLFLETGACLRIHVSGGKVRVISGSKVRWNKTEVAVVCSMCR